MSCLRYSSLIYITCYNLIFGMVKSANILAVFPFTAKSHFTMYKPLLDNLVERGHHLTVISNFPETRRRENYLDISITDAVRSQDDNVMLDTVGNLPFNIFSNLIKLYKEIDDYKSIFEIKEIRDLIASDEKFDLIITELFNTDIFLGFVHKFKAPFISMSASPLMPWAYERFGIAYNPSYVPVVFTPFTENMSFYQRIVNSVDLILSILAYKLFFNPKSEHIAKSYFGDDLPSLQDIAQNTSLILVNTHFSLHSSQPSSRNVIEVGGMHIPPAKPLSQDMTEWLDGAGDDGVIVMSFGSMVKPESVPPHVKDIFIRVFSKLNQRVIWKWGEEHMIGLPHNVRLHKWIPQRDLLEDSRVRVLIYHGGLLGVTEAVHCGVPILGIPLFGDMAANLAAVVSAGSAKVLQYDTLSDSDLHTALLQLIYNKTYKENALKLSTLYRDRETSPVSSAVFWTEYVLRNGGSHLKPPSNSLHFLQLYLIDTIGTIILATVFLYYILFKLTRQHSTVTHQLTNNRQIAKKKE